MLDFDLSRLNILFVDDDQATQWSMSTLLREFGAQVTSAYSGTEAVALLDKNQQFNVVILDIQMPRVTGIEVLKEIRENPNPSVHNLTVVVLTVKSTSKDREEILRSGANYYFSKPTNTPKLLTFLESLTENL